MTFCTPVGRFPLLTRQLVCEGANPACIAQRMNFHPDSVPPFVQLERPWAARNPKVPVAAAGASSQLALVPDDEAATAALLEGFPCREL